MDPRSGRWTVVARGRGRRPGIGAQSIPAPTPDELRRCPFCAGHEERTPPETLRLGGDPWRVRVVPNRYPAFGFHEVVVHSPTHVRSFAELSAGQTALVAEAWRRRARAAREQGFGSVHAFVNEGRGAGASCPHSHSQLVGLRGVPPAVAGEPETSCPSCDLVARERMRGSRVVAERDDLVALCPAAGRADYELLICPLAHDRNAFGPSLDGALALVASLTAALRELEGPLPWNAWLHAGPHWRLELVPRLANFAGLELGAGVYVLTVSPEDAAAALRERLA